MHRTSEPFGRIRAAASKSGSKHPQQAFAHLRPSLENLEPRLMLDAAGMLESQLILPRLIESTLASIKVEYDIPSPSLLEAATGADGQTLKTIALGDAASLGKPGEPVLPVIPAQIILPAGYELADVRVTPGARHVLPGSHLLQAGGAPVALGQETGTPAAPASIYSSAGPFPGSLFDVIGVQNRRGVSILCVNLNPVGYVSASGLVSYYDNLTLHVSTRPAPASSVGQNAVAYRPDPVRPIADNVVNPDMLSTYEESQPAGADGGAGGVMESRSSWITTLDEDGCTVGGPHGYVLITSQAIAEDTEEDYNVGDLMDKRDADDPTLYPTIVTVENILGLSCYEGVDDAESIRNFITDAYNNWGTDYVLLGGDTEIIPARQLWCQALDFMKGGGYYDLWTDEVPSDLYYQCLDGSYNSDGDYYWGEPEDGGGQEIDLMHEVYVGRASAESAEEMSNFVYKTLLYENTSASDPYLSTALIAGQHLHDTDFGPGEFGYSKPRLEEIRLGADTLGYTTAGFDGSGFAADTHYMYDWPGREDDWAGWKEALRTDINNNDYSVFNHIGHGNYYLGMGFDSTEMSNTEVIYNTKPFFAYLQDCISGDFTQDCWAEHATTSTIYGAFAVVANSRIGTTFYAESPGEIDGGSQRMNREFWDGYFAEGSTALGVLNADSHEDNLWGIGDHAVRWNLFTTNLFGDPYTPIRAGCEGPGTEDPVANDDTAEVTEDQPAVIDVLANDSAPLGETLAVYHVSDGVYGTVAINPGGLSVTYTPAPDFDGTDIFTYSAITESGRPAEATVTVTVMNEDSINFAPTIRSFRRGPVWWDYVFVNDGEPQRSTIFTIEAQFSEDVSASLNVNYETALSLICFGQEMVGSPVSLAGVGFSYDLGTNIATWTLAESDHYVVAQEDGAYVATLVASLITDAGSNPLDGDRDGTGGDDYIFEFHRLEADINGNTIVGPSDQGILLDHWGQTDVTPNEGDINLDNWVNDQDQSIWYDNGMNGLTRIPTSITLLTDTGIPGDNVTKLNNADAGSLLEFEVQGGYPMATLAIYADGQEIGTGTVTDPSGVVTIVTRGDYTLTDGSHLITARQKGYSFRHNFTSFASEPLEIVVDTTPPTVDGNPEVNDGALQRHSINSTEFAFSEDVVASAAALGIYYYDAGWVLETASTPDFSSTSDTATWSWEFEELLPDYHGHLVAELAYAEITDIAGNELDGDGDGIAGDDYLFNDDGDDPAEQFHKLAGDMDGDAEQSASDIDYLWLKVNELTHDPEYDLTGDDYVDYDDVAKLVENTLGAYEGEPCYGTFFGDANLDGIVDTQDFSILKAHFGQPGGWADGNFNGDDIVDIQDFGILKDNFGLNNPDFELMALGSVPVWP